MRRVYGGCWLGQVRDRGIGNVFQYRPMSRQGGSRGEFSEVSPVAEC